MAIPIKAVLSVSAKGFNLALRGAGKVLGGFVAITKMATVALLGLSAAFSALVLRQAAVIDRIGKVSKVTGVAAETLQRFSFAAELAGVSTDQAQVALRRFSRRLGEAQRGTGELAPTLKRLGINLKDSNGEFKSAEEVLFDLADAIAETENKSEALSIAFKAFDSEGAELVNVLNQGGDAMRALFDEADSLGAILSADAIKGVEKFNDEFTKLQKLISGISNQFVAALSPALTEVTEDFVEFLKQLAKTNGGFENFGEFLKNEFIDIVITIVRVFGSLANILISVTNHIINFARRLNVPGIPELSEDAQKAAENLGKLESALLSAGGVPGVRAGVGVEDLIEILEEGGFAVEEFRKRVDDIYFPNLAGARENVKQLREDVINFIIEAQKEAQKLFSEEAGEFEPFNIESIIEYLEKLKEVTPVIEDNNNEVEKQLTFFEKIAALLALMPGRMQEFIDKVIDFEQIFENVAARLGTPIERLQKTLEDGLVKGVEIFEDTLTDAILQGKADFSALGDHIKQVLAKALVQRFITGPILAAFGLASGGPAKAGQPYIVGEEGPELFIPRNSGTVIPNDKTRDIMNAGGPGMGGGQTIINISAVDTQSFQQAIAKDPEFIFNVSRAGARRQPA